MDEQTSDLAEVTGVQATEDAMKDSVPSTGPDTLPVTSPEVFDAAAVDDVTLTGLVEANAEPEERQPFAETRRSVHGGALWYPDRG